MLNRAVLPSYPTSTEERLFFYTEFIIYPLTICKKDEGSPINHCSLFLLSTNVFSVSFFHIK